jgi:hexosaminidase
MAAALARMLAVAALLSGGAALLPAPPKPTYQSPELTPWPQPKLATNGTASAAVVAKSIHLALEPESTLLRGAIDRLRVALGAGGDAATIPTSPLPAPAKLHSVQQATLQLIVHDQSEELSAETDESYSLTVSVDCAVVITAPTVFGALHGLQSLLQLFEQLPGGSSSDSRHLLRGLPWEIHDAPRFMHRAMLLDTSRHWLPMAALETHIDGMEVNKLNVLHWHLVDYQAFPFRSLAMPALVKGAYSDKETYGTADVAQVVKYAKDRGVRVMIEIDTPGHSASWAAGYPDTVADCPTQKAGTHALDPSSNVTFAVVRALLEEVGKLAPDSFFHLGAHYYGLCHAYAVCARPPGVLCACRCCCCCCCRGFCLSRR